MRTILLRLAAFVALASAVFGAEPFRDLSYKDALAAAKKDGKIVLIDFYTTWCGPCKRLDKTTWKDKDVQAWIKENAIALKIDAEKERTLANAKHVRAFPTILLLKPDETVIDVLTGYRDAKTFLQEVNDALAGRDSLVLAREAVAGNKKNDPDARMELGRRLAQRGEYKEALAEYLWCYDHGNEHAKFFADTRVDDLVSDIGRLGRHYPPAIETLRARRDSAKKKILDAVKARRQIAVFDVLGCTSMRDVMSINRELEDDQEAMAMFDDLAKAGDTTQGLRHMMLEDLLEKLVEDRRYKDIAGATKSLSDEVAKDIAAYQVTSLFTDDDPEYIQHKIGSILDKGGLYFEVAVGTGKTKTAETIAIKMLHFEKSPRTYTMLINHALRADGTDIARTLAKSAKERLSEKEYAELRDVLKEIPAASESESEKDADTTAEESAKKADAA